MSKAGLILFLALALVASACQQQTGPAGPEEIQTDLGVTSEACPEAVNSDNGCIYLGILSDLTVGPFAGLAVPLTDAQKAFWKRVNEQGGVGDLYDVDVTTYTRDNLYNAQEHVAKYQEIQQNILALAQSLGTPMTLAALPSYKRDTMVAAPASWWSGWEFEDQILESGSNYCLESMNAIDHAVDELDAKSYMTVHYPGDYGGDAANGARLAGTARNLEDKGDHETQPNAVVGNQGGAIDAVVQARPDVVIITTGPREMAEIVGGAAARGFTGKFIGTSPTFNPGLLATPAGPAIEYSHPRSIGPCRAALRRCRFPRVERPCEPILGKFAHARMRGREFGDQLLLRLDRAVPRLQGRRIGPWRTVRRSLRTRHSEQMWSSPHCFSNRI